MSKRAIYNVKKKIEKLKEDELFLYQGKYYKADRFCDYPVRVGYLVEGGGDVLVPIGSDVRVIRWKDE